MYSVILVMIGAVIIGIWTAEVKRDDVEKKRKEFSEQYDAVETKKRYS